MKAWDAIARYMQSFPDADGDGVGNVPLSYSEMEGRKQVIDSKNILDLIKNPNKYAAMIVGVAAIFILVVVLIVRLVVKLIKRMNGKDTGKIKRNGRK